MESFSTALLLLIAISVVLLVYVIYIFFDQRSNLRFASPKSKWAPLIALVLIVIVLLVNLLANALRNYFAKKVKMN